MSDPSASYDTNLEIDTESENALPEGTAAEIKSKIAAERKKEANLRAAADIDIANDLPQDTTVSGIPQKNKYNTLETMKESRFDRRLRAKADQLSRDQARLSKRLEGFNAVKQEIKQQSADTVSSAGFKLYSGTLKSATAYLRNQKRRDKSKKSGKTRGYASRKRSISQ